MNKYLTACLLSATALLTAGPAPAHWASAVSPDGKNVFALDRSGTSLTYSVYRGGRCLLRDSPIGLSAEGVTVTAPEKALSFVRDLSCETPFYTKRSRIALKGNGLRVPMGELSLTVLATDQGVAYRWESTAPRTADVKSETFTLKPKGKPDLLYGYNPGGFNGDFFQHGFESVHRRTPIGEIQPNRFVYLPVTLLWDGAAMAVTEADVQSYPGLNLKRPGKHTNRLCALMAQEATATDDSSRRWRRVTERADRLVRCNGTRTYPWRVFMMADTPSGLYDCDLVEALSPAPRGDFSWVRPGKVAWEWWNHWGLTGVNFRPGPNYDTYTHYIDFASKFGIPYVILDEGWAEKLDLTKIRPVIRMRELIAYAKQRNVKLILWSSWQQLDGRQEAIFSHYAQMGIAGFKTDFMDRDDAHIADFLKTTARAAAKYRLVLDFHGIHKPDGLTHTWPNVLSYEGVYGLEQCKWHRPDIDEITETVRIGFTRLLAGPTDYTPGAMRNASPKNYRPNHTQPMSVGTRCRQAAMFVLYDTGLQMLADSPSLYMKEPEYTRLLTEVPLIWDDTRCDPRSEPDSLLLARRTKGRDIWFAGMVGHEARRLSLPLGADADTVYTATLLSDGPKAPEAGTDYRLKTFTVRGSETLTVRCAPGGGFVLRLTPAK